MAGLFDKQADVYSESRPTYPSEWYKMLAAHTSRHSLAWDAGTGNGQAAVAIAEHYDQVIATDVSEEQLKRARPHPRVRYIHTPLSLSNDELLTLLGGEGSVDLVTVAAAVHWFDLPSFYSLVTRLLRNPGGLIAIWAYNNLSVNPEFDSVMERFGEAASPFIHPNSQVALDGYRKLPFPFESVGLGSEGKPLLLDMPKESSFDGIMKGFRSWSATVTAEEQGVELLSEGLVKEFERAWGGSNLVRTVTYKAFMLAGKLPNKG